MSHRKTSSDVECQGRALASGLGILAVKVVSQTPAVAEHHFDSFSVSARESLAVLWNLVIEAPEFLCPGGPKVCIDIGVAYACRFLTVPLRLVVSHCCSTFYFQFRNTMSGPKGRGYEMMSVYLLFLSLTTISCALRVYCRVYVQKAFGWDDRFAVLAWVSESCLPIDC